MQPPPPLTSVVSSGSSVTVRMTCQQGVMPVPPAIRLMDLQGERKNSSGSSNFESEVPRFKVQKPLGRQFLMLRDGMGQLVVDL